MGEDELMSMIVVRLLDELAVVGLGAENGNLHGQFLARGFEKAGDAIMPPHRACCQRRP